MGSKYDNKFPVGYKFENTHWTVLNTIAIKDSGGAATLSVECDCGNNSNVSVLKLIRAESTHCVDCNKTILNVGDVFGKFTVIGPMILKLKSNKKEYNTWYLCECACGKKKEIKSSLLVSGTSKACGACKRYETVSGAAIARCIHGAKSRDLECDLDIINTKTVYEFLESQNSSCAIMGSQIKFEPTSKLANTQTASIDRIDSAKGYVRGNIQIVHKTINRAKMDMSNEEFIRMCMDVAKHQATKNSVLAEEFIQHSNILQEKNNEGR